jgi:hypothetical protein
MINLSRMWNISPADDITAQNGDFFAYGEVDIKSDPEVLRRFMDRSVSKFRIAYVTECGKILQQVVDKKRAHKLAEQYTIAAISAQGRTLIIDGVEETTCN